MQFAVPADHLARQSPRHIDRRRRARRHVAAAAAARAAAAMADTAGQARSFRSRPAAPPTSWRAIVAAKVSEEFGQQFIVENKTGAGGNIAADFVAKAEPDGYTFVVGTPGTHAINQFVFKNMTYDQVKDIAPVIIIARVPNLLLGHQFAAGEIRCRADRLRQVETGRVVLRHARARQHRACLDRIVQVDDRRRNDPRALQGQRAGADRPDRRPRASDDRQSAGVAVVCRIGRDPPARGLVRNALAGIARSADHRRSRRARLRGGVVVHASARRRRRRRRSSRSSTPASTSSSRPRTASRDCASSAPSPPAVRPTTCSAYVLAETEKWGKVAKFAGISRIERDGNLAYGADQIYSVDAVHHAVELEPFPFRRNRSGAQFLI